MEIQQREQEGVLVFELSGKIIGGPDASKINDKLHEFSESGHLHVVADLSKVNWMNSSGLGIIISALTTVRNAGGELKIAAATEKIKNLLTITKLTNVIKLYDTVEEAIADF
ncbi:anti-sigma factor antagonist [candidate division KSB1 bacterium]|nr:STAS domain-containing protein [candidate division KSB1 bacterium]RQW03245.1 MAG: anti-sigma factor antagonist [candidate division KSB1 bacterium]